jgi:L-alanine-DL-glutamate epimerase-like enolase superfamily enzyme
MRDSDVRVLDATAEFREVRLDSAFNLAGASIAGFTVAYVTVEVVDRRGRRSRGRGASVLSVPWSWPRSALSVSARDSCLRRLVESLAARSTECEPGDPLVLWRQLHPLTEGRRAEAVDGEPVPALAATLALGAVDNAIHDGWARIARRPAFTMYGAQHLDHDLSAYLGGDFRGRWPGDFLTGPRVRLPVQHVVGVGDPLEGASGGGHRPRTLEDWARADRFRHVKLKIGDDGPDRDARRVADVHRSMTAALGSPVHLALDPNESYPDIDAVATLVDRLERMSPEALGSVVYMEQPVPRSQSPDPTAMRAIGSRFPVLVDEGLAAPRQLADLAAEGWHGFVVKAGKGQSNALLCHAFARFHGMFVAVQDLTAVDLALEHSARLAAHLDLSSLAFECNSRQYAPAANARLADERPELVTVVDGAITVAPQSRPGLH